MDPCASVVMGPLTLGDASEPNFKPMAGLVKEEKASTASALSALLGGPSRSSL